MRLATEVAGDVTVFARSGSGFGGHTGADWNGKGVGTPHDAHLNYELGIDLDQWLGEGLTLTASCAAGNLLGFEDGTLSQQSEQTDRGFASGPHDAQPDILVQHAELKWDTQYRTVPVLVRLGRIGVQLANPYVLRRPDVDYYVDNPRWDDGKWYADGGEILLGTSWALSLRAARLGDWAATRFSDVLAMRVGNFSNLMGFGPASSSLSATSLIGASLQTRVGGRAKLLLDYDLLGGHPASSGNSLPGGGTFSPFTYNRVAVAGADLSVDLSDHLSLRADYARADYLYNGRSRYGSHNGAFDGRLAYDCDRFTATAGSRFIAPFFSAPGGWGRIGFYDNPTDIKGFQGGLKYRFTDALDAYASAEIYTGSNQRTGGATIGLTNDDTIARYRVGANQNLRPDWLLSFDWEGVFQRVDEARVGPVPDDTVSASFWTVRLTYYQGMHTTWSVGYQLLDYDNRTGLAAYNIPGSGNAGGKARSGLAFGQFTVTF